jgi:hypothetical protein
MATQPYRIERWKNSAETTLSSGTSPTDTTVSVASAASFPTSGDFRILVGGAGGSVATVKSVSGTTFTLTAAIGGTHSSGAAVQLVATYGSVYDSFKQAFARSDYPYNRILNGATTLTASSFTWLNQGTATCTDADDGGLLMTLPSEAYHQIRGKYITAPSTPWKVTAFCELGPGMARYSAAPSGTGSYLGLFARESSSSKLYMLPIRSDVLALWRMTNVTTFSADVDNFLYNQVGSIWMRLQDDGTDVRGYVSSDGVNWLEAWNEGRTSFMSGGPDQVGFAASSGLGAAGAHFYFKTWIID